MCLHVCLYNQHRLTQPLVIQTTRLIRPFSPDKLQRLPMLKATLNFIEKNLVELTDADCMSVQVNLCPTSSPQGPIPFWTFHPILKAAPSPPPKQPFL